MKRIWLDHYPAGVPFEADVNAFTSIPDMLESAFGRFSDLPAFTSHGSTLTYRRVDELSRRFAGWLQSLPNAAPGRRVALMLPNVLQYPIALFGALRAGMVVVNVNPLYTPRELEHQLLDSGAEVLIALSTLMPVVAEAIAKTQIKHVVATPGDELLRDSVTGTPHAQLTSAAGSVSVCTFSDALAIGEAAGFCVVNVAQQDVAFLQYTGGTTGVSKGAILTHGNIVANVEQCAAWFGTVLKHGEEVVVTALPLYHIFALTVNCLLFVRYGGNNRLIANPRDMGAFVSQLEKPFSVITGVNTLFNGLIHSPEIGKADFTRLKLTIGGGAAIQRAVAHQWQQLTGCALLQGYGLTETSPVVCADVPLAGYSGTIGMPLPSTELSIRDDSGIECQPGTAGEICVRGPQVAEGYWQQAEETHKAFTFDGWFRTGDVGFIDEKGFVSLTDRKKDMILVSGFNVFPNEVEAVIAELPGVLEAAVVGVPNEQTGEAVKAYVVRKDVALTETDVISHCRDQLTAYKVPKSVEFLKELPKSTVGKILRRNLRAN